jgi:hypothetical protein
MKTAKAGLGVAAACLGACAAGAILPALFGGAAAGALIRAEAWAIPGTLAGLAGVVYLARRRSRNRPACGCGPSGGDIADGATCDRPAQSPAGRDFSLPDDGLSNRTS